ncbi:MAG: energy-coupling factor transporter ATPase [Clostridia bacterium]|nr:energy-coupling factor transporter ATPase [Clostridia bacterium]
MRIVAEDISYIYNKNTKFPVTALDGVSLAIDEGDFYGIIGHTGSGKSTFIQHLNALIPVQSGRLTMGEFDLSAGVKKDKKQLKSLRAKVGMVFQYPEYQLFDETVYKDVAFGYRNFNKGATEEEIKSKVYSAMEAVGLPPEKYADKSPFDMSGGQKRRAAIAGVIVTEPEVLILDEPVAGLDPAGKTELMRLLHELKGNKCKTVVIVSHDMDEVADNCDKVAVFSEGKAVMTGRTEEVFSRSKELRELRLDIPVTGAVTERLAQNGISVKSDFSSDGFVKSVIELYKNSK